jgi:hypothetical protein
LPLIIRRLILRSRNVVTQTGLAFEGFGVVVEIAETFDQAAVDMDRRRPDCDLTLMPGVVEPMCTQQNVPLVFTRRLCWSGC